MPGVIAQVHPIRRRAIIIFVGTRDVFGAPEVNYRNTEKPDRQLASYSQQSINRGLKVLARASSAPADQTYLCTIPHRAPFTPTSNRLLPQRRHPVANIRLQYYPHPKLILPSKRINF